MADFFSNLASRVLGAAPDVGPLLPPRFAPWPGIPLPDVAPRPQDLADAPARAGAALLPLPLIDPGGPAVDAPLPTFRQMSDFRSASGPPVQPGQTPVAQDRPETADSERGDSRQAVATPVRPAMDDAPPHALPDAPASTPTSSVIQTGADSDTDNALTASPAPQAHARRPAVQRDGHDGTRPGGTTPAEPHARINIAARAPASGRPGTLRILRQAS
jgi:hypothetical protein